jgi:propionyl-CoA synthetase
MSGKSYIVYGPLIAGCATVLYEGKPVGTPDAAAFWRMISEYKVNLLFSAPTALRAVRRVDSTGDLIKNFDISSLRSFFWAGERADPETVSFYSKLLRDRAGKEIPIVDCFWQTETGKSLFFVSIIN